MLLHYFPKTEKQDLKKNGTDHAGRKKGWAGAQAGGEVDGQKGEGRRAVGRVWQEVCPAAAVPVSEDLEAEPQQQILLYKLGFTCLVPTCSKLQILPIRDF